MTRPAAFDVRLFLGATLADLDVRSLEKEYAADRDGVDDADTFPAFESWLTRMQLGSPVFPGATVEFVRYAGTDIDASVTWRKTATGTLPNQLDILWAQLSAHVAEVPSSNEGIRSPYAPEYPIEALKELARNMVQHRQYEGTNALGRIEWFEDHIEFSNPGEPFGRASEGEFGSFSDYRNPLVTHWLKQLGYVAQRGRGIRLVRKHLDRNVNPLLEVETDGFTRVTVWRRS